MTEQRVRFRDIKPYAIVDSLDELAGPTTGMVTLPVTVHWSGLRDTFDLDVPRDRRRIYQSVLSNGTREDLVRFLHPDLLVDVWPQLGLDQRITELWTERFPQLVREFEGC
ncbi:transcriptional regulator [Brachybacterium sp. UMB0905]|uniref:transcriptional regulator n=1 Tax=Brachybacterium sp. UMB0905 TaxID=2069310 RepID=UPI000C7FE901|nr:transcriptional regulator [Brachybacterium sp. UMB0905]PMC75278.1 transcriptional regulator [Brachybacterium sp. UMB0905]